MTGRNGYGRIPSDISDTAATFCCNHLMYGVLHAIAVDAALERNLGAPSMSVETAAAGLRDPGRMECR